MRVRVIYETTGAACGAQHTFIGRRTKDLPVYGLFTLRVNMFITLFRRISYVIHWSIPLRSTDYLRFEYFYGRPFVSKSYKSRVLPLLIRYRPDHIAIRK